jgi:hypothetical protein
MAIDMARQGRQMDEFNNNQQQQAASNQFWSGLFNTGMQGLGNMRNANMTRQFGEQMYGMKFDPWDFG